MFPLIIDLDSSFLIPVNGFSDCMQNADIFGNICVGLFALVKLVLSHLW